VGGGCGGQLSFVNNLKSELGLKAAHRAALRRFNSSFNSSKVQRFNVTGLFGTQINCTRFGGKVKLTGPILPTQVRR
jgi:hypothetical protein